MSCRHMCLEVDTPRDDSPFDQARDDAVGSEYLSPFARTVVLEFDYPRVNCLQRKEMSNQLPGRSGT